MNAQTQLYHRLYGQPTTSVTGGPAYDVYGRRNSPFTNMAHSMQVFNTAQDFMGPMMGMMGGGPNYGGQNSPYGYGNMAQNFMGPILGMMGGGRGPNSPYGYGGPNSPYGYGGSNSPYGYGGFNSPYGYGPAYESQMQPSIPAFYNSRSEYERQQAGLVGAQANIDKIEAMLRDRRAISPRAGVILKRFVRVGDIVQPGQPLADVGDADQLDVVVEVPIAQVAQVKLGDAVPVTVNGVNLWATVRQIFPAANARSAHSDSEVRAAAGRPRRGGHVRARLDRPGRRREPVDAHARHTRQCDRLSRQPAGRLRHHRARPRDARAEARRHDGRPHRRAGRPQRGRKGDRQSLSRSQVGRIAFRPDE